MVSVKRRKKRYKSLRLSNKNPLDTQLKRLGHSEGYTQPWQLKKGSKTKGKQSLYKGSKKKYEVYK